MDTILYEGPWLRVIQRDGWYNLVQSTASDASVAILVYRTDNPIKPVLGRYEVCPAHGDEKPTLTSITGMVEHGWSPREIAMAELYEEAGFTISANALVTLGSVHSVKFSDITTFLYAFDATCATRKEAPGDGSRGEQNAFCNWISIHEAVACKCPLMGAMLSRLVLKGVFGYDRLW